MNNQPLHTSSRTPSPGINPFAQALEKARGASPDQFGHGMGNDGHLNEMGYDQAEEQRKMLEQQRRERLRQTLHRQVNPIEQTDIFNAKQERVKKEIENVRHELKMLAIDISKWEKEIDITIMANTPAPGEEGKYYITFFQKLRAFIMLLRQKISSARTWATTVSSKKKKRRKGAGLEIGGKQHEQTATVYDRMHHERSTVYSGS